MISKEARAYFGFEKVAEKEKESTLSQDFIAGIDPTGVSTFRNAMKNEKNHAVHKAVGNTGGFIGGALMGAAVPAALTGAVSLAMRKKNPEFAKEMATMAKGSLDAYNPRRMKKYFGAMKELPAIKGAGKAMASTAKSVIDDTEKIIARVSDTKRGTSRVKVRPINELKREIQSIFDKYNSLRNAENHFDDISKRMSKQYFDGRSVDEGLSRSMSAMTALGMAGLTGVLNASSANLQYNTALKEKKNMAKTASEEKTIVTKDDVYDMARAVHEINRHYNKLLMDREDPTWDDLSDEEKNRRTELLSETIPDLKGISAKKMHDMWVKQQAREGWKFGETYDKKKKTHPCIVDWKDLPDLEKAKDAMYLAVIKAMAEDHFGIDALMKRKGTVKEVKVPGGDKVLVKKAGISLYKTASSRLKYRDFQKAIVTPSSDMIDKLKQIKDDIEADDELYQESILTGEDSKLDEAISKRIFDATGLHRAYSDEEGYTGLYTKRPDYYYGDPDNDVENIFYNKVHDAVRERLATNPLGKELVELTDRDENIGSAATGAGVGIGALAGAATGALMPIFSDGKPTLKRAIGGALVSPITGGAGALAGAVLGLAASEAVTDAINSPIFSKRKRNILKKHTAEDIQELKDLVRQTANDVDADMMSTYNIKKLASDKETLVQVFKESAEVGAVLDTPKDKYAERLRRLRKRKGLDDSGVVIGEDALVKAAMEKVARKYSRKG